MQSTNPADISFSRVLEDHPYPTQSMSANGNDDHSSSGLHHRGSGNSQASSASGASSILQSFTKPTNFNNGNTNSTTTQNIPCYIFPCISFGSGETGRSNVKTIFALIFVPLFLVFFFLLDDLGRGITKNMKMRSNVSYLTGKRNGILGSKTGTVKNLAFQRETINVWPKIQRQILVRNPEITLQIRGEDVEAMMKCPRGILFLFHGCGRYASSFYYSPQGRKIIALANESGMITVAVEKSDELGCWNPTNDFDTVHNVGKKFIKSRVKTCVGEDGRLVYPPIFGFGASSGGTFVEELAAQMTSMPDKFEPFVFDAVNIQIMSPTPGRKWDIPTVFTVMEGDGNTKSAVEESLPQLIGSSNSGAAFVVFSTSGRKPIHNFHFAFLFEDDAQMTMELSNGIFSDLAGYGIIDHNDGMLKMDPRTRRTDVNVIWKKYLEDRLEAGGKDVTPFGVSKKLMQHLKKEELEDANSIWLIEELNVAWDEHEITAERFEEVITFFLDNVRSITPVQQTPPTENAGA